MRDKKVQCLLLFVILGTVSGDGDLDLDDLSLQIIPNDKAKNDTLALDISNGTSLNGTDGISDNSTGVRNVALMCARNRSRK
jgi:hypothetical protein